MLTEVEVELMDKFGRERHMAIVKVQQSLTTSAPKARMLIYDESREFFYESDLTLEVEGLLGGRAKAYFHYTLDPDNKILLGQEAPMQSW